ncbi:MAG: hybrid sensor histidine kinase/response regulator [Bacteroidales bacterium]|nr:hybrid sensor histidine kinase/response regulator [Bacteroidales bacterium]
MESHKITNVKQDTILIVDDNSVNVMLLEEVLHNNNYNTIIAKSGQDALDEIDKNHPDLILLDIMMPEMDGIELCSKFKSNRITQNIPVIFLTALKDIESIKRGFSVGGVDYVVKPFIVEELLARVNVHLELKRQKSDLEESNSTKDKLFSIISHDLKSPYANLLFIIEQLKINIDNYDTKKIIYILDKILNTSLNQYKLIENLLEWARLSSSKLVTKPEKMDMRLCIEKNLDLFLNNANHKEISLQFENQDIGNIYVYADEHMIDTVLRNLISNAIKFTSGNGKVIIKLKKLTELVEVTIEDTGIGMNELEISDIFDVISFKTKTKIGTAGETGTGLGLFICRKFIKMNKGVFLIESEEGRGSSIIFRLPAWNCN